jgi:hypothetical protein
LDQQIGCFKECRYGPMEQGEQLTPGNHFYFQSQK